MDGRRDKDAFAFILRETRPELNKMNALMCSYMHTPTPIKEKAHRKLSRGRKRKSKKKVTHILPMTHSKVIVFSFRTAFLHNNWAKLSIKSNVHYPQVWRGIYLNRK